MHFKVTCYYIDLHCKFNGSVITAEGIVSRDYKKLQWQAGSSIKIKFKHKDQKGIIQGFTKKYVVVSVGTSLKKITVEDLVRQNAYTDVAFRIEKDGKGPYTYNGRMTPDFSIWRDNLVQDHRDRMHLSGYEPQPSPQQDSYLGKFLSFGECLFGFKNHAQMFSWFSLADIQMLLKEGFEIKVFQKDANFFDYFYSDKQVIIAPTPEAYTKVENSQRQEYFY